MNPASTENRALLTPAGPRVPRLSIRRYPYIRVLMPAGAAQGVARFDPP